MTISKNASVGTMGVKSQRRVPAKKKMKKTRAKMNSFFKPNGAASIQLPSVANGSKDCKGCMFDSSVHKHGHDLTCPSSEYFGMTPKQKQEATQEKKRMKALKKAPSSEVPNAASKVASVGDAFSTQKQQHQAAVTAAAAGKNVLATATVVPQCTNKVLPATGETEVTNPVPKSAPTPAPDSALSVAAIKVETGRRLCGVKKASASTVANPHRKANNETDESRRCSGAPAQVVAFFGCLLSLVPSRKEPAERASVTNEKLAFCKRVFPPGTMTFTTPNNDTRLGPSDPDCRAARRKSPHRTIGFESPRSFPTPLLLQTWRAGPRALGLHQT